MLSTSRGHGKRGFVVCGEEMATCPKARAKGEKRRQCRPPIPSDPKVEMAVTTFAQLLLLSS